MSTFTPPQHATEVPGLAADTRGQARRCFQNHGGSPRGRNVFYFSNGTVSETDPDCHTTFWTATDGSPYVVQAWWGSTDQAYTLTSAQATALTNAGYTVT